LKEDYFIQIHLR